jgi:hypothetical protein
MELTRELLSELQRRLKIETVKCLFVPKLKNISSFKQTLILIRPSKQFYKSTTDRFYLFRISCKDNVLGYTI